MRDEWLEKIGALQSVETATGFIHNFRKTHTSPLRTTYSLELDYLVIEAKIEERCQFLKAANSATTTWNTAATGEDAARVAETETADGLRDLQVWGGENTHPVPSAL